MFEIPRTLRLTLQAAAIALLTVLLTSCVRPLGALFLGLFSYWLYRTRCSFRVVLTPEMRTKFETWLQRAADWRRNSPSMFCLVSSACLASLAILGHLVSGSLLVLTILVLSTLISTTYNFKLFQIEHKDFEWSEKINYNNVDAELDDEFMPDVNESNLFVLERASDVATISSPTDADGVNDNDDDDDRSDDIPSELLIPDSIPEIDEHSSDEDDELVPLVSKQSKQQTAEAPIANTNINTTSSSDKTMDFRRGHFKRDSSLSTTSSSSEESLSKGLQFPDHTSVDASSVSALPQLSAAAAIAAAAMSSDEAALGSDNASTSSLLALAVKAQAQTLLPNLMSNLVKWGATEMTVAVDSENSSGALAKYQRRQVTSLDSSDESDFEILETDDFK